MKFVADRPLADPQVAARKLLEAANAFEPIQDGRIYIEKINGPFLFELKGSPAEYKAGLDLAMKKGWLVRPGSTRHRIFKISRMCVWGGGDGDDPRYGKVLAGALKGARRRGNKVGLYSRRSVRLYPTHATQASRTTARGRAPLCRGHAGPPSRSGSCF
jgi:hypothetical protein